jgi:hypothetical protein
MLYPLHLFQGKLKEDETSLPATCHYKIPETASMSDKVKWNDISLTNNTTLKTYSSVTMPQFNVDFFPLI